MDEKRSAKPLSPLAEAEMEVLAEGREWMRQRLQEKLHKMVGKDKESPGEPPSKPKP